MKIEILSFSSPLSQLVFLPVCLLLIQREKRRREKWQSGNALWLLLLPMHSHNITARPSNPPASLLLQTSLLSMQHPHHHYIPFRFVIIFLFVFQRFFLLFPLLLLLLCCYFILFRMITIVHTFIYMEAHTRRVSSSYSQEDENQTGRKNNGTQGSSSPGKIKCSAVESSTAHREDFVSFLVVLFIITIRKFCSGGELTVTTVVGIYTIGIKEIWKYIYLFLLCCCCLSHNDHIDKTKRYSTRTHSTNSREKMYYWLGEIFFGNNEQNFRKRHMLKMTDRDGFFKLHKG